jgi:hypothetical protein
MERENMRANVTRAAEGFDRRPFTVAEVLRMQDARIIAENENFGLIEGEIVPAQAKTHVHELPKSELTMGIVRALLENLWMGEFWVVDAARRVTFVHQGPEGGGWRSITERGPDEALIIPALPGFSITLATV